MPRQTRAAREQRTTTRLLTQTLTALAEGRNAPQEPAAPAGPPPAPEPMLVRHLAIQHLGRWIYLPGRPAKGGPRVIEEPSTIAVAGRLVGIRAGEFDSRQNRHTRKLVIAQGSAIAELPIDVTDAVLVAPREW